jgi:hypothetical protein
MSWLQVSIGPKKYANIAIIIEVRLISYLCLTLINVKQNSKLLRPHVLILWSVLLFIKINIKYESKRYKLKFFIK